MHWIKSFVFCSLVMMLEIGAASATDDDTSFELTALAMTPVPIVVQMSRQHQQLSENKSDFKITSMGVDSKSEISNKVPKKNENYHLNDVEIFESKPGAKLGKQEEEPEAAEKADEEEKENEVEPEPEVAAAEEETKDENADAEAEVETAAEPETDAVAEPETEAEPEPEAAAGPETAAEAETAAEPETAIEPETADEPETAAEPEKAAEPETAAETEPNPEQTSEDGSKDTEPEPEPAVEIGKEETVAEQDQDMPNDEPAKEEESVTHIDTDKTAKDAISTNALDNTTLSCYHCTSSDDAQCHIKPTQQANCPITITAGNGKHTGCYTLHQVDNNMTMRGCMDDLAEEGLKYCLTNDKLCLLCYKNGCNNKLAPSSAAVNQLNIYLMLLFNGFSFILFKNIFILFV